MGKLLIKEKEIVIPGEEIAEGMDYLPSEGTFRDDKKIKANTLGILSVNKRVIKVIPLNGVYLPKRRDMVVGEIESVGFSGWDVDVGAPITAKLSVSDAVRERVDLQKSDLGKYFDIGDIVLGKIQNATDSGILQLTIRGRGLRKLHGGRIIKIAPQKVPRVIGKKGSMISMIKDHTKCKITVGQNGYIWIDGPAEKQIIAEKAIKKIEKKAHTNGLTDKIKEELEKGVKK